MMSNRSIPLPVRHRSPDKGSLIFVSFRKNVDCFKSSFTDSRMKANTTGNGGRTAHNAKRYTDNLYSDAAPEPNRETFFQLFYLAWSLNFISGGKSANKP